MLMKTKTRLYALGILALCQLAVFSCEEPVEEVFEPAVLEVAPGELTYDAENGDNNVFTVTSNVSWRLSLNHADLKTDRMSGQAGETQVTVVSAPEGRSEVTVSTISRGSGDKILSETVYVINGAGGQDTPDDPSEDPSDDPDVADAIYYDDFDGSLVNGGSYYIDEKDDFVNKTGSGAASVTYTGRTVSVRDSYPSRGYEGASGGNALNFGKGSPWLSVNDIALPAGMSSFRLTFGNSGDPGKGSFAVNEDLRLYVTDSGTDERVAVTYQRPGTSTDWNLCTAEFSIEGTVPASVDIMFEGTYNVKIDDVMLAEGTGASQTITFGRQYPWPELPATLKENSDYKYISHFATIPGTSEEVRNYAACYDVRRHNPVWVASVHHDCYMQGSGRTDPDPWRPDPSMTGDEQSAIYPYDWEGWPWSATGGRPEDESYYWSARYDVPEYFIKGHLLRSDDRRGAGSDLNIQTFYPTNIAPEMYLHEWMEGDEETSTWAIVEELLSYEWTGSRDTVYVVTGCWYGDESHKAIDASDDGVRTDRSKECVVPEARYRVILKTVSGNTGRPVAECSADELTAIGFWYPQYFPDEGEDRFEPQSSEWIFSVSDIEDMIGNEFDFFPTVPDAVKDGFDIAQWPGLEARLR